MIKNYNLFERSLTKTLDKYLHKSLTHSDLIISPDDDEYLQSFLYKYELSDSDRIQINAYFKKHKFDNIILYHATHPRNSILEEGLLKTTSSRRLSYQSTSGFVYLAIHPSMAKSYSDIGYGISNSVIYEVTIPVEYLMPDTDNLMNQRIAKPEYNIKDTLADSMVYAHTFKVKGNIPPYMIKTYNK